MHYINDPKTQDDAVKIMSARVGLTPDAYKPLLKGTHLIGVAEGKKTFEKADGLTSLYGSSRNRRSTSMSKNEVYKASSRHRWSYIDPSRDQRRPEVAR